MRLGPCGELGMSWTCVFVYSRPATGATGSRGHVATQAKPGGTLGGGGVRLGQADLDGHGDEDV